VVDYSCREVQALSLSDRDIERIVNAVAGRIEEMRQADEFAMAFLRMLTEEQRERLLRGGLSEKQEPDASCPSDPAPEPAAE